MSSAAPGGLKGGRMSRYSGTTVVIFTLMMSVPIETVCITSLLFGQITDPIATSFNPSPGTTVCRSTQGVS